MKAPGHVYNVGKFRVCAYFMNGHAELITFWRAGGEKLTSDEIGIVWEGRLVATWDIAQGKFTAQKVTPAFAG